MLQPLLCKVTRDLLFFGKDGKLLEFVGISRKELVCKICLLISLELIPATYRCFAAMVSISLLPCT